MNFWLALITSMLVTLFINGIDISPNAQLFLTWLYIFWLRYDYEDLEQRLYPGNYENIKEKQR